MKLLRTTTLILGILTMLSANVANAAYLNLGELDVRPVQNGGNPEWFVEYADRGQSVIRYIQIANFSPEKKELEIYSTDGSKKLDANFIVKTKEESPEKIAPWMTMPAATLELNSGETKIVPVKISVPENAGMGLHTGAIIVREKNKADGTEFHVEKGVRVYLNVKGNIVDKSVITGGSLTQNFGNIGLNFTMENRGTTDFDAPLTLELQNLNGETVAAKTADGFVRPGDTNTQKLEVSKPSFGIYQVVLKSEQPLNGETTLSAGTMIIVPLWALMLLGILALSASFFTSKEKSRAGVPAFSFKNFFSNPGVQKGAGFLGILLFSGLMSLPLLNLDAAHNFFASVLETGNPQSYEITVKWGNIKKLVVNKKSKMDWHGQITILDGKAEVKQNLNLEPTDAINLINDGTALNFNLSTTTNNDGIVFDVTPTSNAAPKLKFEDYPSNTSITLDLKKNLGDKIVLPNGLFAASIDIKATTPTEIHPAPEGEGNATPEVQATPEVNINIPELKSIFQDIPATPEVLSEFILTSDYVKKITTENGLTRIEADPALIEALQATPEIIDEIAATPNLNFTFIPSNTVTFPPQQFSFKQDRTSMQDLGTMIFVQNKETPWNTYIGTTNFVSLTGRGVIAAGNLTVIPGDAHVLKQNDGTQINEGMQRDMQGTFDKSILVNVQPDALTNTDSKTIFTMNPRLEIKIPKGTPPGKYRGLFTVTSL